MVVRLCPSGVTLARPTTTVPCRRPESTSLVSPDKYVPKHRSAPPRRVRARARTGARRPCCSPGSPCRRPGCPSRRRARGAGPRTVDPRRQRSVSRAVGKTGSPRPRLAERRAVARSVAPQHRPARRRRPAEGRRALRLRGRRGHPHRGPHRCGPAHARQGADAGLRLVLGQFELPGPALDPGVALERRTPTTRTPRRTASRRHCPAPRCPPPGPTGTTTPRPRSGGAWATSQPLRHRLLGVVLQAAHGWY